MLRRVPPITRAALKGGNARGVSLLLRDDGSLLFRRRRLLASASSSSSSGGGKKSAATERVLKRRDSDLLLSRRESIQDELLDARDSMEQMLRMNSEAVRQEVVPWFLSNMPEKYFSQVGEELRDQHLRALAALRESGMVPELTLKSPNGTVTLISPSNHPGQLLAMLGSLEHMQHEGKLKGDLTSVGVYVAKDNSLSLNIFGFAQRTRLGFQVVPPAILEYTKRVRAGEFKDDPLHPSPSALGVSDEALLAHVKRCQPEYVANVSPRRFCLQLGMYEAVTKGGLASEGVAVDVENEWAGNKGDTMLTLALTNVAPLAALSRVSKFLGAQKIDIARVHLDVVPKEENRPEVTILRVLTTPFKDEKLGVVTRWADLPQDWERDLVRAAKWLDDRVVDLMAQSAGGGKLYAKSAIAAEAVVALADAVHGVLAPSDPYQYARSRVLTTLITPGPAANVAEELVREFCSRHSSRFRRDNKSKSSSQPYDTQAMRKKINATVELPTSRAILEKMQDIVEGCLRTNLDRDERFALSMRLSPEVAMPPNPGEERKVLPFGVFFVHGRRFVGFHLRFREIARGGLRVVTPTTNDLRSMETARQFFECYDLAFAQQLKNKDIAEGGAKGVIVCDNIGLSADGRNRAARRSVRAFTDAMLDLLAPHPPGEILYFGPDEQITPDDIQWIADRAVHRGYPLGSVVISSKRDAGINHKRYGVTSEGVAVFLDAALREAGIDPLGSGFSIKITGGPDGDVAGNMLRILHRNYGEKCRVVGLCDATAAAEDPKGLPWPELLRLVSQQEPLAAMNPSGVARFGKASEPEGLLMRNTMHLRVTSDAFVPAGGRPASINGNNWKLYLNQDGTPSSRVIVEGANLFLTGQARKLLSTEARCLIVKDSSANKCGVITSAYEVLAGMVLPDKDKFLEVKDEYVQLVLGRLRYLAEHEAQFLMREWRTGRAPVLPEACIQVSRTILKVADALETTPNLLDATEWVAGLLPLDPLIRADQARFKGMSKGEILRDRLPPAYLRGLVSKVVGSECVYREGIDFFETIAATAPASLGEKALAYIKAVGDVERVAGELASKDGGAYAQVAKILRMSAPRAVLESGMKLG